MSDAAPRDWSGLAEALAVHVRTFVENIEAVASGKGGSDTVPVLLLETSQVLLVGAQLGASGDVILSDNREPSLGTDPDIDALRQGLADRLTEIDDYVEVFDPCRDQHVTPYRLSDDLADVAVDLVHGLRHYQAGRPLEALWWWQFSYLNHWGNHAGAAMRALHAIVVHNRLDVGSRGQNSGGGPMGPSR